MTYSLESMARKLIAYAAAAAATLRGLAPYALIEIVLPGGSLMALLLWLYRRRKNRVGFGQFPARLLALTAVFEVRPVIDMRSNP